MPMIRNYLKYLYLILKKKKMSYFFASFSYSHGVSSPSLSSSCCVLVLGTRLRHFFRRRGKSINKYISRKVQRKGTHIITRSPDWKIRLRYREYKQNSDNLSLTFRMRCGRPQQYQVFLTQSSQAG